MSAVLDKAIDGIDELVVVGFLAAQAGLSGE